MTERSVDGVLFLFHHFPGENAPTIMEHVEAFERHSRYPVFAVNVDCGFPRALRSLEFRAVVLHYSLFGGDYYFLDRRYRNLLERHRTAAKIAFFQDEMRFCTKVRFDRNHLVTHGVPLQKECGGAYWSRKTVCL